MSSGVGAGADEETKRASPVGRGGGEDQKRITVAGVADTVQALENTVPIVRGGLGRLFELEKRGTG